jgi:hypothetical protein
LFCEFIKYLLSRILLSGGDKMATGSTNLQYPSLIDTFATYQDDVDTANAATVNDCHTAILSIENELGTNPSGALSTLKERLAVSINDNGTLKTSSQGVTGLQGIQGNQGVTGLQGIQGNQGVTGLQGIQGNQGVTGLQGLQGNQGQTGLQGIQGLQGNQGVTGLQGIQGGQGVTGIQGVTGVSGTVLYDLTSNVSSTSTTLADVAEWSFPVTAAKSYKIEVIATYQSAATNTGGKLGVYLSSGGVGTICGYIAGSVSKLAVATELKATIYACSTSNVTGSTLLTTGVDANNSPVYIGGLMVFNCSSSGTFKFQWASESSTAVRLNIGSALIVTQL